MWPVAENYCDTRYRGRIRIRVGIVSHLILVMYEMALVYSRLVPLPLGWRLSFLKRSLLAPRELKRLMKP